MGRTMDSVDISRLADYALFCPEMFAYAAVSVPDARLIRDALERYGRTGAGAAEASKDALRRGIFSAAAELYSYSPMTAVQMKGLTGAASRKDDAGSLVRMYVAVRCAADDIWDASFGRQYIGRIIDDSGLSWLKRLILKYRTRKLADESVEDLLAAFRSEMVKKLADVYIGSDSICTVSTPESFREAKAAAGCSDDIAGLAACIADFPREMHAYQSAVKLKPRLRRQEMMAGRNIPDPLVKRGQELIGEARALLMMCSACAEEPPKLTPGEVAVLLTELYPGGNEASPEACSIAEKLKWRGFSEELQ